MFSRRSWITLAGVAVMIVPAFGTITVGTSAAMEATTGFVTLTNSTSALTNSEPREWWVPGGGSITASGGTRNEVVVDVAGGPFDTWATFSFAAPVGDDLRAGTYVDAVDTSMRPAGSPGIDIKTDSGGSYPTTWGSFIIRDIAFSSGDTVARLDLSYSLHYRGETVPVTGQISINEPQQDPGVLALPTIIRFPKTYAGLDSQPVRVRYVNTGLTGVRVDGMKLAGRNPGQFSLWRGGCVGTRLAPQASCIARVRFVPVVGRKAPATARLVEWDTSGRHVVALGGWLQPGYTSLRLAGDADDYITGGQSYLFRPTNAAFYTSGSARQALTFVTADGTTWYGQFVSLAGRQLEVDEYLDAVGGDDPPVGHPILEFTSSNGSCTTTRGSFRVYEYDLNPVTGVVEAFSVTWTQYCDSQTDASYGSFVYHATDPAKPLPAAG